MPGVSRKTICAPSRFRTPSMDVRVVWGFSDTIATFPPTRAFNRVDLPALGRPMMETKPERWGASDMCFLIDFRDPKLLHLQLVAGQDFDLDAFAFDAL